MKKILVTILVVAMMLCVSAAAFADGFITLDQAKQFALDYVGVSAAEASFTKAYQDWEIGGRVYEIEFWVGSTEYEMDVDARTGRVSDFNVEYHGGYISEPIPAPIAQPIPAPITQPVPAPIPEISRNYRFGDWDDWDDWDDMYDRDWDDMFDWD